MSTYDMLGTILNSFYILTQIQQSKLSTVVISTLKIKKLGHRLSNFSEVT